MTFTSILLSAFSKLQKNRTAQSYPDFHHPNLQLVMCCQICVVSIIFAKQLILDIMIFYLYILQHDLQKIRAVILGSNLKTTVAL